MFPAAGEDLQSTGCLAAMRYRKREGRASPHGTPHRHLAAVRGHDLLHEIQPQPGSIRFRSIQGLEDLRKLVGGNARAGILDSQLDLRGRTPASEPEDTTFRHRRNQGFQVDETLMGWEAHRIAWGRRGVVRVAMRSRRTHAIFPFISDLLPRRRTMSQSATSRPDSCHR